MVHAFLNMVLAFLLGLVGIFAIGMVALLGARWFTSEKRARISAFSVALGYAVGKFSFSGPATLETVSAGISALGAVAALVAIWAWLLRGSTARPESVD